MKTTHRDIVGGFIFSKDGKLLLGKNRKGGVYEGQFVVPAGGVEDGETKEMTLQREIKEETGIDIAIAVVSPLNTATGEHKKTLQDTGEQVFVKMNFYNYRIDLHQNANEVIIKTGSDWHEPQWFALNELNNMNVCEPTLKTLITTGIIKNILSKDK